MNRAEYEEMEARRIERNLEYLDAGVVFIDLKAVYIDEGVRIGKGTVIYPCVVLEGDVEIGENCTIGQNTRIKDSIIGNGTSIQSSVILESKVGDETSVGPFAYLRPNSEFGSHCKVGDFVEIKNSTVGKGTSVSHLTYVGDSDVGKYCNFGCGVVTVNYDGAAKHRNTIGDYAFIGCNTNLVAPVSVGDGAYTAAGSTITDDVPAGALGIARARQVNKPQWAKGKLEKFIAKQQAKEEAGSK